MPIWLIPVTRTVLFSLAIGQFVVFRRKSYESIGGYATVSGKISDDIHIARQVRKAGFRAIFLDIRKHVRCRMYKGFHEAYDGLTKNISDFLNYQIASLLSASLASVLFFLLPYGLLLLCLLTGNAFTPFVVFAVALFQLTWCFVLYDRGLKWFVPFLYPLVFLFEVIMMWRGYGKMRRGEGLVWKGRMISGKP
jgi:chlorobactene glucosyltransferase